MNKISTPLTPGFSILLRRYRRLGHLPSRAKGFVHLTEVSGTRIGTYTREWT